MAGYCRSVLPHIDAEQSEQEAEISQISDIWFGLVTGSSESDIPFVRNF